MVRVRNPKPYRWFFYVSPSVRTTVRTVVEYNLYVRMSVGVRPSIHSIEHRPRRPRPRRCFDDGFFFSPGRSCVLYGCIGCSWALKGGIGISRRGGMERNGTRAFFFDDDRDFLTSRDSKKRRRLDVYSANVSSFGVLLFSFVFANRCT